MNEPLNTDFAIQREAISGRFQRDYQHTLAWLPAYVQEFPLALKQIPNSLSWEGGHKFISTNKRLVPDSSGIYCFSLDLGEPFPKKIHLPMYIGKARNQYLSERFADYLTERGNYKGREKIVFMLNKYKEKLLFWWVVLPIHDIDIIEDHLLMCCKPPCNDKVPNRERLWGKAF